MRRLFATSIFFIICLALASTALAQQRIDLGLITVKNKAKAEEIRDKLLKGASFEALAKSFSVGPAAFKGGRLGMVPPQTAAQRIPQGPGGTPGQPPQLCDPHRGRLHHPHDFCRPAQVETGRRRQTGHGEKAVPQNRAPDEKASYPHAGREGPGHTLPGGADHGGHRRGAAFPAVNSRTPVKALPRL